MEHIFLGVIQLINKNRFWAMPVVFLAQIILIAHMLFSEFRGE